MLNDDDIIVYDCDCACATSDAYPHPGSPGCAPIDTRRWIQDREMIEIPLKANYSVLFNPLGKGGATVVNQPARQILQRFQMPLTFKEASAPETGCPGDFQVTFQRLAELGIIHPIEWHPRPAFQGSQVLTAWLHITNACNLRCSYCYLKKTDEVMDEATGRAAVEAVVRSAMTHGFPAIKLKYAGGEPTLNYPLVLQLHDYAQAITARIGIKLHGVILSNGVAFPSKLIEALKARGIRVMISLDEIGSYHDTQRPSINGKPSFHPVERTISSLIEAGHAPHLSITVTQRNLSGLSEVVRFALERNLTFSFNFFRDNQCAASFPDLKYQEQAMIDALLGAFDVIVENIPTWSVLGSVLDRGQLLQPRERPCGVGRDYVVINQRGQVAKCHMDVERTLGNVFQSDPLLLVQQDKTGVQNPSVDEKEECRQCPWHYWCAGGCPIAAYNATGRFDVKSPNCNIYRAIFPEALKLEGLRLLKVSNPVDGSL
jgi:uncharacterized protein